MDLLDGKHFNGKHPEQSAIEEEAGQIKAPANSRQRAWDVAAQGATSMNESVQCPTNGQKCTMWGKLNHLERARFNMK